MTTAVRVPTAADVLNYARSQLGIVENPLGSNNVPYNVWYYGRVVTGSSYPWCAVFVSYVAEMVGAIAAAIIPRHAYTPSGASWFKARGRFGSTPRVGAIAYYNISGLDRISHCGIVETVFPDGTWIAIEGNTDVHGGRTGGKVMRQHRSRVGAGGGFGYPDYAESPPPPPPRREPLVVDGDLGPATIRRWQQIMGTPVDGVISEPRSSLVEAVQRYFVNRGYRDLAVDGALGPRTISVLQGYLGASVDGDFGPQTTMALQRRLNTGRF